MVHVLPARSPEGIGETGGGVDLVHVVEPGSVEEGSTGVALADGLK